MSSTNAVSVRVDDRLIHGQVVTVWVRGLNVKQIWVVSDRAANEPIEVILLKSSVPAHLSLEVYTAAEAIAAWTAGGHKRLTSALLILTETIGTVIALIRAGIPIDVVNIGGIRYKPGRTALSKAVYMGEEEIQALHELESLGVPAHIRILPSDAKVDAYEKARQKWKGYPC